MTRKQKSQSVTHQQAQDLLSNFDNCQDMELSDRYGGEIYKLSDGRILAITNGVYRSKTYPSAEMFTATLMNLEKRWQGSESHPTFVPLKKAFKLLERDSGWHPNYDLRDQAKLKFSNIYEHDRGQILAFPSEQILKQPFSQLKGALLYDSLDNYLAQYQFRSRHILTRLLPQQNQFIVAIPQLCNQLSTKFSIPQQKLDKTQASLSYVELAIKRYGKGKCLSPEIFPHLLAYIGEVIRQKTEGIWEMKLTEEEIWEPWIVAPDGRKYEIFIDLHRQLSDEPLRICDIAERAIDALNNDLFSEDLAQLSDNLATSNTDVLHIDVSNIEASGDPESMEMLSYLKNIGLL